MTLINIDPFRESPKRVSVLHDVSKRKLRDAGTDRGALTTPGFCVLMPSMLRELVWIDQPRFRGWGCSQCAWVFNPPGPPVGDTPDAMKRIFELRRDEQFASHVCARYPRRPKQTPDAT